jgi:hypothetical protein
VIVMAASLGSECALEGPAAGHGFFTLGLVEALTGRADFNRDKLIHLNEANLYARVRVRELSGENRTRSLVSRRASAPSP